MQLRTVHGIVLTLNFLALSQLAGAAGPHSGHEKFHLSPAIKAGKDLSKIDGSGRYRWQNPSITVNSRSITVSWGKNQEHSEEIQPDGIESFMVRLPVSAWPYGRIVEVQDSPLGDAKSPPDYRSRSWAAIKAAMKRLNVEVKLGPPSA
jgi:hypothetical protein